MQIYRKLDAASTHAHAVHTTEAYQSTSSFNHSGTRDRKNSPEKELL
jgi:hypothetical protein